MAKKHKKRVLDYSEIRHAEEAAKVKPAAAADSRPAAAAGAAGDNRPPRLTGGEQKTQRPLAGEQKIDWAAYQESEYFKTFVTNQRGKLIERRTKTDKQDAKLIADYCEKENPPLWKPLSEKRNALKVLNRRIEQLNVLLNIESNRQDVSDTVIKSGIERILEAIKNEIESCKKAIQNLIDSDKELSHNQKLLQTISGVGKSTAAWLLSVLVDIDKFENSKKLISYLGLSPVIKDSGTSVRQAKISKMGDKKVRKALYYPARAACLRSKLWRPWFEQKIKQGKHPKQIYILMMCKIVKYAYAVIKTGQPFDENRHKPA